MSVSRLCPCTGPLCPCTGPLCPCTTRYARSVMLDPSCSYRHARSVMLDPSCSSHRHSFDVSKLANESCHRTTPTDVPVEMWRWDGTPRDGAVDGCTGGVLDGYMYWSVSRSLLLVHVRIPVIDPSTRIPVIVRPCTLRASHGPSVSPRASNVMSEWVMEPRNARFRNIRLLRFYEKTFKMVFSESGYISL